LPSTIALLVCSAAPTLATEDSAPPQEAATTSTTCYVPRADEVLTAADSLRFAEGCRSESQAPAWHWMGNYGSVYDVVAVANQAGVGPGGLITQTDPSGVGLLPTFMYY
jgi:hypothetical protein